MYINAHQESETPRNPTRWELRGPAPHQLGKRKVGLTEAITKWKEQSCSPQGVRVGQAGLGQWGPVDPWVVEGTVVLIAAVALHHEVSADRAV